MIALSIISILFLGYWVKNLRRENIQLETRAQVTSQIASLKARVVELDDLIRAAQTSHAEEEEIDGITQSRDEIQEQIRVQESRLEELDRQIQNR